MGRRKESIKKALVWNVALYIRLSKEDGNDESLSVGNQRDQLLKFLDDNLVENFVYVDTYIDDGRSGTDSERPNFRRMFRDIEEKRINCVIVKDLSRLSRNNNEAGIYLEQYFVKNDVRFISLSLPTLDSYKRPEEISSIATKITNVMNDEFCYATSTKIRNTFNVKREMGEFIGSFAPYGYIKDPDNKHHLLIDEEVAPIVRDIFQWYLNGMSKLAIAKKLNELGVLCPAAYKKAKGLKYENPNMNPTQMWSERTVYSTLHNQMYIGNMVQGRQRVKSYKVHDLVQVPEDEWFIVPDTHEPIISKEMFYDIQELLARNTRSMTNKHETWPFAGIIQCADCRKAMHSQKGRGLAYYVCSTYKKRSTSACTRHTFRLDKLENIVISAVNNQLLLIENMKALILEIANAPTTCDEKMDLDKAINSRLRDIEKANRIRDELYLDLKEGLITKDDYFRLKDSHDRKLGDLREALISLKEKLRMIEAELNPEAPIFTFFKQFQKIDRIERGIVLAMIDMIYIYEGGEKIEISFKFADQQKLILDLIQRKLGSLDSLCFSNDSNTLEISENQDKLENEQKIKKLSF